MIPQYMAGLVDATKVRNNNDDVAQGSPLSTGSKTSSDSNLHADEIFQQCLKNAGPKPRTIDSTIHDLFAQQVALRPHAQAVEAWDGAFTYTDVDALSKNLALQLIIRYNISAEDLVPFCMTKSKWVPVAVLGILKAGAACAAFDPVQPRARLAELTEQIQAKVIVTDADCEHIAHCLAKRAVVADERLSYYSPPPQTLYPSKLLQRRCAPHNAAVVQFSSGSTGVPKAIVVEHVALATSFDAFGSRWKIDRDARVFQYAAHTFDVAIGDLLAPLTRGGCVCIPSEHERLRDLAGSMRRMQVNWTFFTPTLAKTLKPSDVPSLRTLVMGGEAVLRQNLTTWANDVNLILAYGMAESSIYCSSTSTTTSDSDAATIGTPFGGRVWIVSDTLTPLPPGETGEMLVEGPILARGYLDNPALTASAFIPTPAWLRPYSPYPTLLRTGDYARFTPSGTLQFAGRKADHLAARAFPAELSDVEHAVKLSLAPHVLDVVVELLAPKDKYGLSPTRLVAVYVPLPGARAGGGVAAARVLPALGRDLEALRKAVGELGSVLPGVTVPSAFVPVDRLPLTVSGKCDRRALRALLKECELEEYAVGGGGWGGEARGDAGWREREMAVAGAAAVVV